MTIQTNTANRRVLADHLARLTGETCSYLGAPSFAYQVGPYTINRDGSITGEDFEAIQDFLLENCYIQEPPASEADTDTETSGDEDGNNETEGSIDEQADSEAVSPDSMEIAIPARDVTPAKLKNLVNMLYSRQDIINRMTDSGCLGIPEVLVERLKEYLPENADDFTSLLDDCRAIAGMTGFDYRDGRVTMTFPFDESKPEAWTAYATLLQRIYDAAMKATRVFPERVELNEQNEKYFAHVWLQRLGYGGADSKTERKVLLGHLKGYCAFGNSDKMQAHRDKYAAIRQKKRKEQQGSAAVENTAEESAVEETETEEAGSND
ncbi:MAG: hypothetical protein IKP40_10000 [Clostridia bacterium]|nr:hypothetical protein [Clostridia bacterium]